MTNTLTCRHCNTPLTQSLVDLGLSPLANSYVPLENKDLPCATYPLHARVCSNCYLVQVEDAVPKDKIFSDEYAYFSSFSDSWLAHCKTYVNEMTDRLALTKDDLVIEIASNDGYLLQYFVEQNIPVLGIEPAANVAAVAQKNGVETRVDFFTNALASSLVDEGIQPSLICSANVLAHVPNINDFVQGIATLLTGDAVYTVEFPHLLKLIENVQFDTIYHEHYTYLSLTSVEKIFESSGLRVFDVQPQTTHGGSLRVFACQQTASYNQSPAVASVREQEHRAGLTSELGYQGFEQKVRAVRAGLLEFLNQAKTDGKTVAAYGAAAKGNTLLNYCDVNTDLISYCVDRNPAKQNTLLPGSHIPVFNVDQLRKERPDYVLILPWNLKTEIAAQLTDLADQGSKFVTPVPAIEIFS
ncbi:MAG: class I SAM-dependent methyltransferase [Paracoccaceae bacterium]